MDLYILIISKSHFASFLAWVYVPTLFLWDLRFLNLFLICFLSLSFLPFPRTTFGHVLLWFWTLVSQNAEYCLPIYAIKESLRFFKNYLRCNCTFFPQHIGIITTCFLFQTDEFITVIFVFTSIFSRSFLSALVRFLSSRFYDIFLGCQGFSFLYDISYHFFFVHNINKLLIVCSENLVFIAWEYLQSLLLYCSGQCHLRFFHVLFWRCSCLHQPDLQR